MKGYMKRRIPSVLVSMMYLFVAIFGSVSRPLEVNAEGDQILIEQQAVDVSEIPDKYNTGATGSFTKYVGVESENANIGDLAPINALSGGLACEIAFKKSSGAYVIDFGAPGNNQLPERVEVNNYDFTSIFIRTSREDSVQSKHTIVFKNCIFDRIDTDKFDRNISYEFYNCKFRRFVGSNAYFDRCAFGGSYEDPLVPFRNIEVNNSYFSDLNYASSGVTHIDATQIYGYRYKPSGSSEYSTLDVKNVKYKNCRFEVPNIAFADNKATVNACVMIQLEFSDAYDVTVENCILNGGVYSIFTQCKENIKLQNITIKNTRVGAAKTFGAVYPNIDKNAVYDGLTGTDSLYIGSVYKQGGKTYFSVSNDTNRERKLKIVTSAGAYDFTIPAGVDGRTNPDGFSCAFTDLPLDIIKEISEDCAYAVCLDVTDENNVKQIRFVNYTGSPVYIDKSYLGSGYNQDVVLQEGALGDALTYSVTRTASNEYVLRISGNGSMPGYTKVVTPPWFEYQDFITKIIVEEGVQNIGQFAFFGCFSASDVELLGSISSIGKYAFANCSSIENIQIPDSVKEVGDKAFVGVQHLNEDGSPKTDGGSGPDSSYGPGNDTNGTGADSGDGIEKPDDSVNDPSNDNNGDLVPKDVADTDDGNDASGGTSDGQSGSGNGDASSSGTGAGTSDGQSSSGNSDTSSSGIGSSNSGSSGGNSYSSEWVDGKWYDADGQQTYPGIMQWKSDSKGWWIEDSTGWYPVSKWQKINGYWYYFDATGYMASSEWVDGYWLGSDGAWTYPETGAWKSDKKGWWYSDTSGWYATNRWQKIDGYWYYFNSSGYIVTNKYIDGYWLNSNGQYQAR